MIQNFHDEELSAQRNQLSHTRDVSLIRDFFFMTAH
jgi:hypothetical protein